MKGFSEIVFCPAVPDRALACYDDRDLAFYQGYPTPEAQRTAALDAVYGVSWPALYETLYDRGYAGALGWQWWDYWTDRDDGGQAKTANVFDVFLEIIDPLLDGCDIGFGDFFQRNAAVEFRGWSTLPGVCERDESTPIRRPRESRTGSDTQG